MAYARANGIRIRYELTGREDQPVVMLSNSLGTDLAMWDPQMPELAVPYRILRYDARGHGATEAPDGPYTIEQLADDAIGLLDALEIERAHFCGLSLGGMIGQVLGARHRERLQSLALCATACHLPPKELWDGRIRTVSRGGMKHIVDAVVERWFTEPFRAEPRDEVERVRRMILATPPEGYAGCCAAIRDMDLRELIGEIEVPTLVMVGDKDPATPVEAARTLEERVPNAELRVIPEAAHLVNIEQPIAFNQALTAFLGRAT